MIEVKNKYSIFLLLITFISLSSSLDLKVFDVRIYQGFYDQIPKFPELVNCFGSIDLPSIAPFFIIISSVVKFFGGDLSFVVLIFSLLTVFLVFYSIFKFSFLPYFSLIIYSCLFFYFQAMGQIRQGVSMAFVLISYHYLVSNKYLFYFVCLLFASLFHYSALIFLPSFLLIRFNYSRLSLCVLLLIAIFISLIIDSFVFDSFKLNSTNILYQRILIYSQKYVGDYNSLAYLEKIVLSIVLLLLYENKRLNNRFPYFKKFVVLYLAGVFGYVLLINKLTVIAARGFEYYLGVIIFIFPMISVVFKSQSRKIFFYSFVILYYVTRFSYKVYLL